jgi:hypothetical protein
MTLMGIVKGYSGLLAARFFLGVAEAGLFPGVAYYLTMQVIEVDPFKCARLTSDVGGICLSEG